MGWQPRLYIDYKVYRLRKRYRYNYYDRRLIYLASINMGFWRGVYYENGRNEIWR